MIYSKIAFAVGGLVLATPATQPRPILVSCWLTSVTACQDGACIADRIISHEPIRFNFRTGRFSSRGGAGAIKDVVDEKDGTHIVFIAAAPIGARDVKFSSDYKTASVSEKHPTSESSTGYSCKWGR